jgi:multidrug resistance efflux pump
LARLQGVQRALSQAERDRDSIKDTLTALRQELAQANARAASEYAERIKSTQRDIVPDLIRGETIEQVDASLSASRAAFAVARQAYARTIPTPSVGNPLAQQQSAQPPSTSAVQLISQGLRQPQTDINQ